MSKAKEWRELTGPQLDWFHDIDDHLSRFEEVFGHEPDGDFLFMINGKSARATIKIDQ